MTQIWISLTLFKVQSYNLICVESALNLNQPTNLSDGKYAALCQLSDVPALRKQN